MNVHESTWLMTLIAGLISGTASGWDRAGSLGGIIGAIVGGLISLGVITLILEFWLSRLESGTKSLLLYALFFFLCPAISGVLAGGLTQFMLG